VVVYFIAVATCCCHHLPGEAVTDVLVLSEKGAGTLMLGMTLRPSSFWSNHHLPGPLTRLTPSQHHVQENGQERCFVVTPPIRFISGLRAHTCCCHSGKLFYLLWKLSIASPRQHRHPTVSSDSVLLASYSILLVPTRFITIVLVASPTSER
jgi:hypothetical protein